MYCINCGVKLADTERKCPLCGTTVYHPDIPHPTSLPMYPHQKMPQAGSGRKAFGGLIIFLFLFPLIISIFSDLQWDMQIDWSGYVAGALILGYVAFALPMWFRKPNPVILIPCNFIVCGLYLLYINFATNGNWFLSFALPVTAGVAVIVCAVVTLVYYLRRGKLYIFGGAIIASGALILMIELLLVKTFRLAFIGWSVYPLIVLTLLGGGLIHLAINSYAREIVERKLFF